MAQNFGAQITSDNYLRNNYGIGFEETSDHKFKIITPPTERTYADDVFNSISILARKRLRDYCVEKEPLLKILPLGCSGSINRDGCLDAINSIDGKRLVEVCFNVNVEDEETRLQLHHYGGTLRDIQENPDPVLHYCLIQKILALIRSLPSQALLSNEDSKIPLPMGSVTDFMNGQLCSFNFMFDISAKMTEKVVGHSVVVKEEGGFYKHLLFPKASILDEFTSVPTPKFMFDFQLIRSTPSYKQPIAADAADGVPAWVNHFNKWVKSDFNSAVDSNIPIYGSAEGKALYETLSKKAVSKIRSHLKEFLAHGPQMPADAIKHVADCLGIGGNDTGLILVAGRLCSMKGQMQFKDGKIVNI